MKWLDNKWGKLVLSGTALILIYKLLNNFNDVAAVFDSLVDILFPVILGLAIAFFLSRPAEKLAKLISKINIPFIKRHALIIGVAILYAAIFLILAFSVKFVAPKIYKNIEELAINIPVYFEEIKNFVMENDILSKFNSLDFIGEKVAGIFDVKQINKYIGIISGIANSFMSFFLALILSVYMILITESITYRMAICKSTFAERKNCTEVKGANRAFYYLA